MIPTHIDLFSGIGGFSLAFESEGFHTIAFSEINPDKCLVYEHHFPGVPNLGDIKLINGSDVRSAHGPVDVITGGVPCQPASSLGQMRGTADERWLWPETIRLVGQIRPRFGLFENPPSLIALNRGREWNGILSGFSALGYDCWWDVFPAAAFGAGHLRERVLLVVTDSRHPTPQTEQERQCDEMGRQQLGGELRDCSTSSNPNLSRLQGHPRHGEDSTGRTQPRRPASTPDLRGDVANSSGFNDGRRGCYDTHEASSRDQADYKSKAIPDLRGRCNIPDWWHEANSGVPVLAHGLPPRLVEAAARCAGDSVVPQVIQPIAKAIFLALSPFSEE